MLDLAGQLRDLGFQFVDLLVVAVDDALDELRLGHLLELESGVFVENDLGAGDAGLLGVAQQALALRGLELLAREVDVDGLRLALHVGLVVVDVALAEVLVLLDQALGAPGEIVVLDHLDAGQHARDEQGDEDDGKDDDSFGRKDDFER